MHDSRSYEYRKRKREAKLKEINKCVCACNTEKKEVNGYSISPIKESKPFKSDSFVRKKCSEINKLMPKRPETYVKVLRHLWNQASRCPEKRSCIKKLWSVDDPLSKYMYLLGKYKAKKKQEKIEQTVEKIRKHHSSLRNAWKKTNMHWNEFHRATKCSRIIGRPQKKFIRKLDANEQESIESFLCSDDASFPLPDKKYAGKRFLKTSLKNTLKMYHLLRKTTRRISMTTLRRYKPKHIKLRGKIPFRQSCCEVCQNFDNILDKMSKHLKTCPKTIEDACEMSMCQTESYFPNLKCAFRECSECGTQKAIDTIRNGNEESFNRNAIVMVKQWQNKKEYVKSSDKIKTYMHWKYHRLSMENLLKMFADQLETLTRHSFFGSWNFHQYLVCKNNIEKGEIILVIDYSQNYLCVHQNEVQALHWVHAQVTLHPICVTYRCPIDGCNELVLHEVVHVSDDMTHDAHLVRKMLKNTFPILRQRGVEIKKIIEWSDQAPSQYKNKSAFHYIAQDNIPTMRNFFGVRHGKGPCDACTGRVKQGITNLVKSGEEVVNSAQTFFEVAKKHLEKPCLDKEKCCHYVMNFVFTDKIAKRPNTSSWKGVKDTRDNLHSIVNCNKGLRVNARNIICMCPPCLHGEPGNCHNIEYTDNWRGFDMQKHQAAQVDMSFWSGVQIRKIGGSRLDYNWDEKLVLLNSFTNFEELLNHVDHNPLPFLDARISTKFTTADNEFVDPVSLHYRPSDCPDYYVPCRILGDGNCFPRTMSHICFRTQNHHVEMRVRLVYEGVHNWRQYINNRYLAKGASVIYRRAGPCHQIALYSSAYDPQHYSLETLYKKEVMDLRTNGTYCGLWQMCQAANVLKHPIKSVFPETYTQNMRLDFNRDFMCLNNAYNNRTKIYIMWTAMQVDRRNPNNCNPCHFVPMYNNVSC